MEQSSCSIFGYHYSIDEQFLWIKYGTKAACPLWWKLKSVVYSAFLSIFCSSLLVLDQHGFHFPFCIGSRFGVSGCVFKNCCRGPEKINCRNELWRCAREIQIFVKILGPTFELVLLTLTSDSSWFLDWFWLQGLHLINTKIEGPCCSHGRRLSTQPRSVWFQLSENWLILVAGGCQR